MLFHSMYEVHEQAKLINGERSHNLTTVVTSGVGVELPNGPPGVLEMFLNVLYLEMSGVYRDIHI